MKCAPKRKVRRRSREKTKVEEKCATAGGPDKELKEEKEEEEAVRKED